MDRTCGSLRPPASEAGARIVAPTGLLAMSESARIRDHFAPLTDPRRRKVVYPLIDIITIALCAVIAGADDFVAIAEYGRKKRTWLSQFLDLRRGVPSHDRFSAIFAAIKPAEFERSS